MLLTSPTMKVYKNRVEKSREVYLPQVIMMKGRLPTTSIFTSASPSVVITFPDKIIAWYHAWIENISSLSKV